MASYNIKIEVTVTADQDIQDAVDAIRETLATAEEEGDITSYSSVHVESSDEIFNIAAQARILPGPDLY